MQTPKHGGCYKRQPDGAVLPVESGPVDQTTPPDDVADQGPVPAEETTADTPDPDDGITFDFPEED